MTSQPIRIEIKELRNLGYSARCVSTEFGLLHARLGNTEAEALDNLRQHLERVFGLLGDALSECRTMRGRAKFTK